MAPRYPRRRSRLEPASRGGYNQRPWIRNPMERLDIRTFSFHFRNLRHAYGRNRSYLCFWVERVNPWSSDSSDFGVFVNQGSCHVELCFLSWFRAKKLFPNQQYHITWYLSWSPCLACAVRVAEFLMENRKVSLRIFTAHLCFKKPESRDALRRLYHQGASVKIMSFPEFNYCWENFVYNEGMTFQPWKKLRKTYKLLHKNLEEILRNPMERLDIRTFSFHFRNLRHAYGRNRSYLCFWVERVNPWSSDSSDFGVFVNQGSCHVELCFLSWFRAKKLFPNQQYHITWYLSWSPCLACAVRVAEFLMENRKVSLRIFTAHLCFKKPESRDALRRLYHQGASVKIMSFPEFNYCWENFVYNEGMTFQPWKKLRKTYKLLHKNLEEILRNPMERLDIRTFSFHFRNLRHAYGRNRSYLCFWVERVNPWSSDSSDFGVFVNQASCHAELSFLSWFLEEKPSPDEQYEVTWYLPWSPCLRCSEQVAEFLMENGNVTLSIFASRLYYFKKPESRDALRRLYHQGASVKIMSFSDFNYCWENFVYNQGMPFQPWEDLRENYESLAKELEEILGNPMEWLDVRTFSFHFRNLRYANGRNCSYLCFWVERVNPWSSDSSDFGVFANQVYPQTRQHAEISFLSWFRAKMLSPDEQYEVTWFLSWSPCLACAEQVAEFLRQNRNVTLRIFAARLYYFWKPEYRAWLRRLHHQGTLVNIMSFSDFKYCWEMFVYNQGMPFQPWENLRENYESLVEELEDIFRNPVERLGVPSFSFHFRNLPYAYSRNGSYLCFQVERLNQCSSDSSDFGVFANQASCHAELSFLSWFLEEKPSPDEQYEVTWYLPWSPCLRCSEQVAEFLMENGNVTLSIFASRLYYFWKPEYRDALRRLHDQGALVDIMCFPDFDYCWENFVYNQGMPFQPWEDLDENYEFLVEELEEILGNTMNLLKENTFEQQFGNQRRVQAPYSRRKTYLCYQLKQHDDVTLHKGCFRNKKKRHAEIRFIKKINSLNLDPNQNYKIICYITWSPCPDCARELVNFIKSHDRLSLHIFASRLYFHWIKKFQWGLQQLQTAQQVSVAVMTHSEFEDCWKQFVDHQGRPFQAWDKLDQYSESIKRRLRRILTPLNENNLVDSFRGLRLGSPSPSSLRSDLR